jgi:predicted GNAT family N-acyltransferase
MLESLDNITIKKAEGFMLTQVKRFYREHKMKAQAPKTDDIYIALLNNKLIGALRLCPYENSWLLRSMCIKTDMRGKGIGRFMLNQLTTIFHEKQCYCFPFNHLENFYKTVGFEKIPTGDAAEIIEKKYTGYLANGKKILLMQFRG